jgi:hypothetical protein
LRIKKYDYLINDNGDIWMVESVHKNGSATVIFPGGGTGDDELTYSAGEVESFFRKLPKGDYSDREWLDPKPYWSASQESHYKISSKSKPKKRKSRDTHISLGSMR